MNTPPYARSGIYIKPENRGKFTSYANRHGESVQEAASRILGNKEDYPPYLVKRANFARNAAGWQKGQNGMEVEPPPSFSPLSFRKLDPLHNVEDINVDRKNYVLLNEAKTDLEDIKYEIGVLSKENSNDNANTILSLKNRLYQTEKDIASLEKSNPNAIKDAIIDSELFGYGSKHYEDPSIETIEGGFLPTVDYTHNEQDTEQALTDYADETRRDLMDIYRSKGFQRKLNNEFLRSRKDPFKDTSSPLSVIGNKMYRVANTPIASIPEWNKYGHAYYYPVLGSMSYEAGKGLQYDTSIKVNPYSKSVFVPGTLKSVLTEELEHASHIVAGGVDVNSIKGIQDMNITPYAYELIGDSVKAVNDIPNETHPTEVIAKKRALEIYLIDKGMLSPGQRFTPKHLQYVRDNYNSLPTNIQQLIDVTGGKEKRNNIMNIMNRIASNEQGGTMNYGRYGMQVSPYIQKGQNGMMAGYPPNDPIIQPYGYNQYSTAALFGTRPILSQGALEVSQQTLDNETPNRNYLSTTPLQSIPLGIQVIRKPVPVFDNVPHVTDRNESEITMPPNPAVSVLSKTGIMPALSFNPASIGNIVASNQVQRPIPIAEDVPHVMDRNEPEITVQQQQQQGGVPAYFDLIKTLDMGALLRNMVQGPPPSVQTPLTHFQRIKYDRGLFDTSRQQLRESGARSMYEARQQLGQAGDIQNLMLGLNAQQQQGLAQLGQQQREMDMQERLANQQIQAQEEQTQDQQVQQEAMLNYQIQQQAQMAKDQAVSTQLSNIKKDIREQTQYEIMKEAVDKQDARDEAYRKAQEQIGLAGTQMTLESMYQSLPQYQEGLKAKRRELLSSTGAGIMEQLRQDPNYSSIIPQEAMFSEQTTADLLALPERVRMAQDNLTGYQTDLQQNETQLKKYQAEMDAETDETKRATLQSQIDDIQGKLDVSRSNVQKMQEYYQSVSDEYKWKQEAQKRFNQQWDMSSISKAYDTEFRGTSPLFKTMEALSRYVQ